MRRAVCHSVAAVAFGVAVSLSHGAHADPCSTIICLGGLLGGASGGPACNVLVQDYFAIKVFTPQYNPPLTAIARQEWLATCPTGPKSLPTIEGITAMFGGNFYPPAF